MVRGSAGIILVSHVATVVRQTKLDTPTWTSRKRCLCTFFLTKSILGLPDWIRSGHRGVGDIRPACLFLLVRSKCFLDSRVRRCCKVGHSCMRRGLWIAPQFLTRWPGAALPRANRTVARLIGPGCEFFDTSQLRLELDSMFHELDKPAFAVLLEVRPVVPCPALVLSLQILIKLALPQRCSASVETHLSD